MKTPTTAKLRDLRSVQDLPLRSTAPQPARRKAAAAPAPLPPSHAPLRLLWLLDSLPMRAGRRLVARILGRVLGLAGYAAVALVFGFVSAWYMVGSGSRLTVESDGPWHRWILAGSADADPYTRAHFDRAGWLPLDANAAIYYTATRDGGGEPMYSDCEYTVSGPAPVARRWTVVAYDMNGQLLDPGAGLAAISSDTAVPGPGGSVSIHVAQMPSSGNWLSVSGATRMQLVMTLFGVRQALAVKGGSGQAPHLFSIQKTGCR